MSPRLIFMNVSVPDFEFSSQISKQRLFCAPYLILFGKGVVALNFRQRKGSSSSA
ncbi:hypothetical protein K443DRAFT_681528 [Laccaria amethystina LaAM-08-1]|uniref:Uncharacterized protein n=1 Tax=Laccaria amethystina LaAM-08-1 TaxID=1095629 RepID=A0A0C9XIN4_9AGAR|nr:hypothetical protein K443DRAFT_681528 [Laccaria amethystina LaAM-08-1]